MILSFLQHPVYCLKVVGTQNAHNLISISTDGKLCSWSLDMLSQPQETLELQNKQSKQIAVTQLAFPSGDVNNFVVGSEDGTIYSGNNQVINIKINREENNQDLSLPMIKCDHFCPVKYYAIIAHY